MDKPILFYDVRARSPVRVDGSIRVTTAGGLRPARLFHEIMV